MDRHGPKTKEDFKDSLVFQRDLAEMLGQEVKALQARCNSLELSCKEWQEENARLRKALEGLTNAALAGIKPLPSQVEAGFEALRELDGSNSDHGEKKSSPGCTCQEWSGALCGYCQKVHNI